MRWVCLLLKAGLGVALTLEGAPSAPIILLVNQKGEIRLTPKWVKALERVPLEVDTIILAGCTHSLMIIRQNSDTITHKTIERPVYHWELIKAARNTALVLGRQSVVWCGHLFKFNTRTNACVEVTLPFSKKVKRRIGQSPQPPIPTAGTCTYIIKEVIPLPQANGSLTKAIDIAPVRVAENIAGVLMCFEQHSWKEDRRPCQVLTSGARFGCVFELPSSLQPLEAIADTFSPDKFLLITDKVIMEIEMRDTVAWHPLLYVKDLFSRQEAEQERRIIGARVNHDTFIVAGVTISPNHTILWLAALRFRSGEIDTPVLYMVETPVLHPPLRAISIYDAPPSYAFLPDGTLAFAEPYCPMVVFLGRSGVEKRSFAATINPTQCKQYSLEDMKAGREFTSYRTLAVIPISDSSVIVVWREALLNSYPVGGRDFATYVSELGPEVERVFWGGVVSSSTTNQSIEMAITGPGLLPGSSFLFFPAMGSLMGVVPLWFVEHPAHSYLSPKTIVKFRKSRELVLLRLNPLCEAQ